MFSSLFQVALVLDIESEAHSSSSSSSNAVAATASSSKLRKSIDTDALASSFVPIDDEHGVSIEAAAFSCGQQLHRFCALYLSNNQLLFHFAESASDTPVVKLLAWLPGDAKRIVSIDIDARGSFLLLTTLDASVTLIPIYFIVKNRQFFSADSLSAPASLSSSASASSLSSSSGSTASLSRSSSSLSARLWNLAGGSVAAAASLIGVGGAAGGAAKASDDADDAVGASPIVHWRLNVGSATIARAVLWNVRYVIAVTTDSFVRIFSLADGSEVYAYRLKTLASNVTVVSSGGVTCALLSLGRDTYMLLFLESGKQTILRDANDSEPVPVRRKGAVSVQHMRDDDHVALTAPDGHVEIVTLRDATAASGFPIYEFRLPTVPQQMLFGKHVIFLRGNQTELFIVSRALASSPRGKNAVDPHAAVLARYDFGTAIRAIFLLPPRPELTEEGVGEVDGVLLVLGDRVLEVRANQTPASLFGALVARGDVAKAERLGVVFELDVLQLLDRGARARLEAGDGPKALELFVAANADACSAARQLAQRGFAAEARSLLEVAYAARASLGVPQRRALILALATLYADALVSRRAALESRVAVGSASVDALVDERRCAALLSSEADVDVDGALQMLMERQHVDLMLVMAHARGEVERALALLATQRQLRLSEANVQFLLSNGYARPLLRNESLLDDVSAGQRVALLLADNNVAGDWRRRARALLPRLAAPQLLVVARALLDSRDPESVELRIEVLLLLCAAVRHSPSSLLEQLKAALGTGEADRRNDNADSAASSVLSLNALSSIDAALAVRSIACGDGHVVAVAERGILLAWGSNGHGQLGLGDTSDRAEPSIVVTLAGVEHASAVACGAEHSVAVTSTGYVYAWGAGESGQLGYTPTGRMFSSVPRRAALGSTGDIVSAACGERFVLLLTHSGAVLACGANGDGQLGLGDRESRSAPTLVPNTGATLLVAQVAAGARHSVVRTAGGELFACGAADRCQLGSARDASATTLTPITSLRGKRIVRVACGATHNVALTELGHVYSWGDGVATATMMQSLSIASVADVVCGHATVLALTSENNLLAWRSGDAFGKAVAVPPDTRIASIACAPQFCAAVTNAGVPLLWTEEGVGVVSIVASMSAAPTAVATPLVSTLAAFVRSRSPALTASDGTPTNNNSSSSSSSSSSTLLSSTGAPIEKVLTPLKRRMVRPLSTGDLEALDVSDHETLAALTDELCDTTQDLLEDAIVGSFGVYRSINVLRRCLDAGNMRAATLVASALGEHVCALECALEDAEAAHARSAPATLAAAAAAARLARAMLTAFDGVLTRVPREAEAARAAMLRLLLARWSARALPRKLLEAALAARIDEFAPAVAQLMGDASANELVALLPSALRVDVLRSALAARDVDAGERARLWHEVQSTLGRGLTAKTHVVSHKAAGESVAFTCGHELTRDAFNNAKAALASARADAGRLFTRQLLLKDFELTTSPISMACPECVAETLALTDR